MKGSELWQRAIRAIPGGNGLLSKRPDRYAPDLWPTYFSKAKGVSLWDLDNQHYIDMAQMGMGSCLLGYSHDDVNQAVQAAVASGVNTTLNAPEEVYLAEKLLDLNPFAGGVKFTRTGGEAMALAIRIARAASGRDTVAFSGYHGWSDWYLATNLKGEDQLSDHLLPGLSPAGVPQGLKGSALPFRYNDVAALEKLAAEEDFGVLVIEGARYDFPTPEFLEAVQRIARQKQAVLVVDEITSGWRMTDGGYYQLTSLQPDMVVYGKGMGNGFAISAVVGKADIMDYAQETFISSTFWTERVGFVAALTTLEFLCHHQVWKHLIGIGNRIGQGWERLAQKHGLRIHITEYKPLISFKFDYGEQNVILQTLFIQEMLKRGYLAATSVYVSYSHTPAIVDTYLEAVDAVFDFLSQAVHASNLSNHLQTHVREEGFKRLT